MLLRGSAGVVVGRLVMSVNSRRYAVLIKQQKIVFFFLSLIREKKKRAKRAHPIDSKQNHHS